mgnify:CR=1 FL=1
MENPIAAMPITGGNFVDALIVERDKLKADLTAEIAADGFDIGDYEDDIRDSVDFTLSDHATEIEDIVRDVLRAVTVTLDV